MRVPLMPIIPLNRSISFGVRIFFAYEISRPASIRLEINRKSVRRLKTCIYAPFKLYPFHRNGQDKCCILTGLFEKAHTQPR
jgi:hypothetical protein